MINSTIRQYVSYGIGNLAQQVLGILLIPLYLRFFAPSDFGVITTLLVLQTLVVIITGAGITSGLEMLYYEAETGIRKRLAGNTWWWYIIGASLLLLILVIPAQFISELLFGTEIHRYVIQVLGINLAVMLLTEVPLAILRLEKKAGHYVILSLIRFGADLALKITFIIYLGRGIAGFFESGVLASMLMLIAAIPFVFKDVSFRPDIGNLKKLLRLGSPLIINGLALWTLGLSDRLILNYYHGTSAVGIYGAANSIANIFNIVVYTPFVLFWNPFLLSYANESLIENTKRLFVKFTGYALALGGLIVIVISLGSRDLILILIDILKIDAAYFDATGLVPWLVFGIYFLFLQVIVGSSLYVQKRPQYLAFAGCIAAVVNLGLNFALIPKLSALGAAIATMVAYGILLILVCYWARRCFRTEYPWFRWVAGLVAVALTIGVGFQLTLVNHWASIFTRVLIGVVLFGLYIWFASRLLSRDEKQILIDWLRQHSSNKLRWPNKS